MTCPPFTLRPPQLDDVLAYTRYLADADVSMWLDDSAQIPVSAARVEALLLRDAWCLWCIDCEGSFVGVTSLYEPDMTRGMARFSIVIGDRACWNRGLGTAVLDRVLEHAFISIGLRKIESEILEPNKAAQVIHERAGFVKEGQLRQDSWRRGKWVDRIILSLLREEWLERNPAR